MRVNRKAAQAYAKKNPPTKFDRAIATGAKNFATNMKSMPQAFKTVGSQIKTALTPTAKISKRRR